MASGPITSWKIDGETLKTVVDLILGGSKITADGDWSHQIKRRLLLGRKVMTNLDSILKSRDITFPTKVRLVKTMVFPVVKYGCESWTIKKAEHQRIDAFELWCWRRLLRVPWTTRRSHQSIIKEIRPECSLEGLMLRLKLQYFGHLLRRADSFEETVMLGKIEGERRGQQRIRWLDGITDSMYMSWVNSGSWWWTGRPGVLQPMGSQRVRHDWATELNWILKLAKGFSKHFLKDIQTINTWKDAQHPWSLQKCKSKSQWGLPWWPSGKESASQFRRRGLNSWSRKGTTKSTCYSCWSPHALEPVLCNKRSHHNEKPAHHNKEKAPLATTREKKKPKQQQKPRTAINKYIKLLFQKITMTYHFTSTRMAIIFKKLDNNKV